VKAVNFDGTEIATSAWISVIPDGTVPQLAWMNTVATVTGTVSLAATKSLAASVTLLIDGAIYSGAGLPDGNTNQLDGFYATLESDVLSNGMHVAQMFGYVDNKICVTPPMAIQVSNSVSHVQTGDLFDPSAAESNSFTATLPAGSDHWMINVTNDIDGSAVTSWTGNSANVKATWDGTASTGADAPDGTYTVELVGFSSGKPPVATKKHVTLGRGVPQGLALLAPAAGDPPALVTQYTAAIRASFGAMHNTNGSFMGMVLVSQKPLKKSSMLKIRGWLQNNVQDFYYYGHGGAAGVSASGAVIPQSFSFGGTNFWPDSSSSFTTQLRQDSLKYQTLHFFMNSLTGSRSPDFGYNFVMIDCCHSGGDPEVHIYDNSTWYNGFNLDNTNFFSCFWGWYGCANTLSRTDGSENEWSVWRKEFWRQLGINGTLVINAGSNATTKAKMQPNLMPESEPWGQYPDGHFRAAVNGDTFLP